MPRIYLIAAIGKNRELGFQNQLIWRIPEDLKRFKALTMGHPIVMGKKTFDSIGRPLPSRTNIVLTNDPAWRVEGVIPSTSLEKALEIAREKDQEEIFVIGGASVYAQALPLADRLYLTRIEATSKADVFFPDYSAFSKVTEEEMHEHDGIRFQFIVLERV